jgi:hypothetical protein
VFSTFLIFVFPSQLCWVESHHFYYPDQAINMNLCEP